VWTLPGNFVTAALAFNSFVIKRRVSAEMNFTFKTGRLQESWAYYSPKQNTPDWWLDGWINWLFMPTSNCREGNAGLKSPN
jgi:hypothetical protein